MKSKKPKVIFIKKNRGDKSMRSTKPGLNETRNKITGMERKYTKIRQVITEFEQLTSKYLDKQHLLAGDNTFISCNQYDDLAKVLYKAIQEDE